MADIELLRQLLISHFYEGRFELTSRSTVVDWYVDVRPLLLDSSSMRTITRLFLSRLKHDIVVGSGISGSLIVSSLLGATCKPLKGLIVRDSPRSHGLQKIVEGDSLIQSKSVTFVDDIFTTGSTLESIIKTLEKDRGCKVGQALVLVDRSTADVKSIIKVQSFFKADALREITYLGRKYVAG